MHPGVTEALKNIPANKQQVAEAFDQPYKILRWEKGDYGDVDAIARLDDGTFLSIMFNKGFKQETKEEAWSVEFFRNNSQEVTGEGDEFRVFATVLSAIQTFVSDRVPGAKGKYKPNKIYFSASKKVEPGQKEHSRAGLYDSLVQRHAKALGFRAFRADTGNIVMYELSRIKPIAEDMSRRGFLKGAGAMAAGISAAGGARANNQTDPNKLIAIVNINGESKEFNLTGRFKGDAKSQLHQAEEFITEFLEKRDINFSNLELRYQGTVLKTQNIGSVKEEQGVAENMDHNKDNQAVEELKAALIARKQRLQSATDDQVYDSIDKIMTRIAKTHSISGQKLHDMWVDKYHEVPDTWIMNENFADGKKPGRKGLAKRVGVNCKQPVSKLRSIAANSSGERQRMAHWCANMKSGKKK